MLPGKLRVKRGATECHLVELILEAVTSARDDRDDAVLLGVIKAVHTLVCSPDITRLGEGSLLLGIRAVYHLCVSWTRAPANKATTANRATAKTVLVQMLACVFKRMEDAHAVLPDGAFAAADAAAARESALSPLPVTAPKILAPTLSATNPFGPNLYPSVVDALNLRALLVAVVVVRIAPSVPPAATLPAAVVAVDPLSGYLTTSHRDAFYLFRSLCRLTAVGDEDPLLPSNATSATMSAAANSGKAIASVPVPSSSLTDDELILQPITLASRMLSLELLIGLLEGAGSALRNGPRFVAVIKKDLCVAILKNFASTIPALSSLSMRAFMAIARSYKRQCAAEMEVFISTSFLRILQSALAPVEQKLAVLAAFASLWGAGPDKADQQSGMSSVLEMFLNYDCTEGRQHVFEDSVRVLATIAQGRIVQDDTTLASLTASSVFGVSSAAQRSKEEAALLRVNALYALSAVCSSIVLLADKAAERLDVESGGGSVLDGRAATANVTVVKLQEVLDDDDGIVEPFTPAAVPSTSPQAGAAATASSALARSYDEQKRRRALIEKAAVKFAMKPKKGVEFMQANGLCGEGPAAIAACFIELKDLLDKTAIGEYMGEGEAKNIAVMHAYVDQLDFAGLTFDDGLRTFLAGFRIPGEAQKIDRMMEKFAERFCANNPGVFPSADSAFILSYSVIMLHTDAHNPNIKPEKKMKRDNFVNNNRGIANGGDLPTELQYAIYDSIVSRPFTMREDDVLRSKLAERAGVGPGEGAQRAELDKIVLEGRAAMVASKASDKGRVYFMFDDVGDADILAEHVRSMFDVSWGPLLATFSVNFETVSGDESSPEVASTVNTCLQGFNQLIRVACALRQDAERDILVGTLARFTTLESGAAARELRGKHISASHALLTMAINEGAYLGTAWGPVLQVVSAMSRLINLAHGGKDDSAFLPGTAGGGARAAAPVDRREAERLRVSTEREAALERSNAALLSVHIREADVTRIFTASVKLPSAAIADFVTQLAAVSLSELSTCVTMPAGFPVLSKTSSASGAAAQASAAAVRIFSLQKVVEVADFNMDVRPRMAWARIWDSLGRYFTAVCTSSVPSVAMFAIDSLKQLSLKFLSKPELKSFSFQTRFLAPFVAIMELTAPGSLARGAKSSPETRELILHVSANIIRARTKNIRSGWSSFLGVFATAASDSDEALVSLAFATAHEVLDTHWASVAASGSFVDAVKCMVAFGGNRHELFALRAVDHCATLGAHLARGRVPLSEDPASAEAEFMAAETAAYVARAAAAGEHGTTSCVVGLSTVDWYDLDGSENNDVIDDARDRGLLAALPQDPASLARSARAAAVAAAAAATAPRIAGGDDGGDPSESARGASDFDEQDPEAASEEAFHEGATRAAMQNADDLRGGLIRRFTDVAPHLRLWWPLLTGLAGLLSHDPRASVRMRALHALSALLRRYGPAFSSDLWCLVYSGVLLPVFDDVRAAAGERRAAAAAAVAGTVRPSAPPPYVGRDMEGGESAAKPHYSLAEFSSRAIPAPALFDPSTSHAALSLWPARGPSDAVGTSAAAHDWLATTCLPALAALVRLQARFFARQGLLLEPLLGIIGHCIDQDIEGLARIGVACLRLLLAEMGPRFDAHAWNSVAKSLVHLFEATTPKALLAARRVLIGATAEEKATDIEHAAAEEAAVAAAEAHAVAAARAPGAHVETPFGVGQIISVRAGDGFSAVLLAWATVFTLLPPPASPKRAPRVLIAAPKAVAPAGLPALPFSALAVVTQCVVQLELIGAVSVLADAHMDSLSLENVETLLGLLQGSADFARRFNGDRPLRRQLWEAGFMRFAKHAKLPSLLRQESCATQSLLFLLLRLYKFGPKSPWHDHALRGLTKLIEGVTSRYGALAADVQRAQLLALPTWMHASLQFTAGGGSTVLRDADSDALLQGEHARDLFREAAAYGPLMLQILDGLLGFDDAQFKANLTWLMPLLIGLVGAGSVEVRQRVARVLQSLLPAASLSA